MRFALYVTLLVALLPLIFTRPFFGLCVYYVVSLLQPKLLCWRPDFQDALLVGVPLVMGAIAIGVHCLRKVPVRDAHSRKLLRIDTRLERSRLLHPCWTIILFGLLVAYIAVTRLIVPFPLEPTSYQFRGLCKVLLVAVLMTGLITEPKRFRILFIVVALSTAFWAVKGGFKVILIGPHQVYGKSYDNNLFALTSVMTLPMVFYYGLAVKHAKWRGLLLVCSALICLGIIGSRSRAGFVAFGVVLLCMAWTSRYRMRALLAVSVVAAVTAMMSGPEILDRLQSIFDYADDRSARSRFFTWQFAWQLFLQNPLIGVGFNNFETAKLALGGGQKAAHNIFLQNLSELGVIGSALWMSIVFGTMLGLFRLMRRVRVLSGDMKWVYYCARGLLLGLVAFCVHGFFHNEEYIELMFVLVALAASLRAVADRQWFEIRLHAELAGDGVANIAISPDQPSPQAVGLPAATKPAASRPLSVRESDYPRTLGELLRRNRRIRPDPSF